MGGRWLDTDMVVSGPIPADIRQTGIEGEEIALYNPFRAVDRRTLQDLDNNGALIRLLRNSDIDILLRTIGNAFFPRRITIGTTPTEIITPNRYPKGYILINPNTTVSGVVTTSTVFASQVFPVGTTDSALINVSGHGTAAFFLDVTEATAQLTIDLQTQDPVSGNWAAGQRDIFGFGGGPAAIGTYYANCGPIGVDQNARLSVVVAGDTMTASIGAVLKPALAGTIAGPTVFLGNENVTTTLGFPLLSGQKEVFYLKENTPLYGVAVAGVDVNLFELQ